MRELCNSHAPRVVALLLSSSPTEEEAMRRAMVGVALVVAAVLPLRAELPRSAVTRVNEAATVLKEIHAVPEKDIPQDLWDKAACVIVIPGLKKAAFGIGGE